MRIIVGISGASGAVLGIEMLKALKSHPECETHLIVTQGALTTLACESEVGLKEMTALADCCYDVNDLAAPVASGSFKTDGMVIIPCSMKTLAAVVHGYADNLLVRAADVCLKEKRRLILVPRETPLSKIHLRNLMEASDCGCTIIPPMLTFYNRPKTIEDQVNHIIGKILMQFGLEHKSFRPWNGGVL